MGLTVKSFDRQNTMYTQEGKKLKIEEKDWSFSEPCFATMQKICHTGCRLMSGDTEQKMQAEFV